MLYFRDDQNPPTAEKFEQLFRTAPLIVQEATFQKSKHILWIIAHPTLTRILVLVVSGVCSGLAAFLFISKYLHEPTSMEYVIAAGLIFLGLFLGMLIERVFRLTRRPPK